jgi:hypothetical protein
MRKHIIPALIWSAIIIAIALAAAMARRQNYIDSDTVDRIVISINGLVIAWFGNRLPKTLVPNACAQRATRVAAWSMVLSGLIYAGLWAFAPMPVAMVGGCGAVIAGITVTLVYCLRLRSKAA